MDLDTIIIFLDLFEVFMNCSLHFLVFLVHARETNLISK